MKKNNIKKLKRTLPFFAIGSFFSLTIPLINSCSTQNNVNKLDQNFINEQYNKFYNSLVLDSVKDNLYFQNFDFDKDSSQLIINDVLEIEKFISLEPISNYFQKQFIITKNEKNNYIDIELILKDENEVKFKPEGEFAKTNIKRINNVKSLNNDENNDILDIHNQWSNFKSKLKIINDNKEELLETNYKNILPTYLSINNFNLSEFNEINTPVAVLLKKNGWTLNFIFNPDNQHGTIEIKLEVINEKSNLNFVGFNNDILTINGFVKQLDRDIEVLEFFKSINKTYSLKEIINSKNSTTEKFLPFLPSTISNIEILENFLNVVNTNNPNNIFELPFYFSKTNDEKNKLWYDVLLEILPDDSNGRLNVTFTMIDKFTKTPIMPENIVKVMTFNNMLSLGNTVKVDDSTKIDNSSLENGYRAYNLFNKIKINESYKSLPTQVNFPNLVDFNWLKNNTNIKKVFDDSGDSKLDPNTGEFTIESPIYYSDKNSGTEKRINTFRIAQIDASNVIKDDVEGIIKISIILEIKLNINGNDEWIKFYPPTSKKGEGKEAQYSSWKNINYMQIGNYRNKDVDLVAQVYNYINTNLNNKFEIIINNEYFFDKLKQSINYQNQILEKLETQIDENFKELIKKVFNDEKLSNEFLNKFSPYFNLEKIFIKWVDPKSEFETDLVDFKISVKNNDYFINYYEENTGTLLNFPQLKIVVKLVKI